MCIEDKTENPSRIIFKINIQQLTLNKISDIGLRKHKCYFVYAPEAHIMLTIYAPMIYTAHA
jgi:hypothetical protein